MTITTQLSQMPKISKLSQTIQVQEEHVQHLLIYSFIREMQRTIKNMNYIVCHEAFRPLGITHQSSYVHDNVLVKVTFSPINQLVIYQSWVQISHSIFRNP